MDCLLESGAPWPGGQALNKQYILRAASGLLVGLFAAALPAQFCLVRAATPQRLTEQFVPESSRPQETTASLGKSKKAAIHQWGILTVKSPASTRSHAFNLPLPNFAHTTTTSATAPSSKLEYSALYIHPPMMLKEPLKFDIRTGIRAGCINAWYPYAPAVGNPDSNIPDSLNSQIIWKDVLAGVQADTLKTTNPIWMMARSVEAPATVKVYKPGPMGSKPDDPGTTEGEVFLFLRGQLFDQIKTTASAGKMALRLNISPLAVARMRPSTTAPLHSWVIAPAHSADQQNQYRFSENSEPASMDLTLLTVPGEDTPVLPEEMVRAKFNEAFAGHGLDPDEADAMTRVLLKLVGPEPSAVLILPRRWVDAVIPLDISGSPAESPVRVFVAVCELPRGTNYAIGNTP